MTLQDADETLPILEIGDPVLRVRATEVAADAIPGAHLRRLVARMVATMRAAPGVGLAAPQVGVAERIVVVEDRLRAGAGGLKPLAEERWRARERVALPLTVVFNPRIEVIDATPVTFFESCLSVPGYCAAVTRMRGVRLTGLDAAGAPLSLDLFGWPARILQHEVDHLDGTLYVDRMHTRSLCTAAHHERLESEGEQALRAAMRAAGVAD